MRFNTPPGWPAPPPGWTPPAGWTPDKTWPAPPDGWQLLLPDADDAPPTEQPHTAPADAPPPAVGPADPATRADAPADRTPAPLPPPPAGQADLASAPAVRAVQAVDDRDALLRRVAALEAAVAAARAVSDDHEVIELSDQRVLQDVGIYRYHHPLESAAAYQDRLTTLNADIDGVIKAGHAVLAADMFTFDGSLARGRRMVADLSKLMLRAYNAEADNCVRALRSGNLLTARKRLESAVAAIERLGVLMEMRVNPDYHALRLTELELTADYQMKVQVEREKAREERELLREQRRAEAELAAEKQRLEKERAHYLNAIEQLRSHGDPTAAGELEGRLADIDRAIAANDYRIANIRAGYVYVISNVGAFGPNVVKIGMTRRLEPMERVRELGNASVPFRYDVHALHFSDDAVALEHELHQQFADRRVNVVNERREFFFASPSEVRDVLLDRAGGLLGTPTLPRPWSTSRA